jgi:predicted nucleic acid-binding protein
MPYLLDTNAAIVLMKGHPARLRRVQQVGRSQLRLCAPVEGELWFGVAKSLGINRVNRGVNRGQTTVSLVRFAPAHRTLRAQPRNSKSSA